MTTTIYDIYACDPNSSFVPQPSQPLTAMDGAKTVILGGPLAVSDHIFGEFYPALLQGYPVARFFTKHGVGNLGYYVDIADRLSTQSPGQAVTVATITKLETDLTIKTVTLVLERFGVATAETGVGLGLLGLSAVIGGLLGNANDNAWNVDQNNRNLMASLSQDPNGTIRVSAPHFDDPEQLKNFLNSVPSSPAITPKVVVNANGTDYILIPNGMITLATTDPYSASSPTQDDFYNANPTAIRDPKGAWVKSGEEVNFPKSDGSVSKTVVNTEGEVNLKDITTKSGTAVNKATGNLLNQTTPSKGAVGPSPLDTKAKPSGQISPTSQSQPGGQPAPTPAGQQGTGSGACAPWAARLGSVYYTHKMLHWIEQVNKADSQKQYYKMLGKLDEAVAQYGDKVALEQACRKAHGLKPTKFPKVKKPPKVINMQSQRAAA